METGHDGEPIRLTLPWRVAPKAGTIVTVASTGVRRRYLVLSSQSNSDGSSTVQVIDWPAFKTTPSGPYSSASFDRLRAWRLSWARRRGVAAYVIATDATLKLIAASRATTLGELARLKGVGPNFIMTYGNDVLEWLSREPQEAAEPSSSINVIPRSHSARAIQVLDVTSLLEAVGRPIPSDQPMPTVETVWAVVDTLPPRMAKIVSMRYGRHGPPMTLGEVGRNFNVTRERIRQIQVKALRRLGHPSRWNRWWPVPAPTNEAAHNPSPESVGPEETGGTRPEASDSGPGLEGLLPLTERPIVELGLSLRPYNALRRAGKRTIGDLLAMSDGDLTRLRNFGRASLTELDERLTASGFARRDTGSAVWASPRATAWTGSVRISHRPAVTFRVTAASRVSEGLPIVIGNHAEWVW